VSTCKTHSDIHQACDPYWSEQLILRESMSQFRRWYKNDAGEDRELLKSDALADDFVKHMENHCNIKRSSTS
jgi:hypothetical protein